MELTQARDIVYQAGLDLAGEGLVARTWGNISLRLDSRSFLITPSGRRYETLKPSELVVVTIEDLSHEGSIKPSSEKGMHAEIYALRPDINAVVHTHQRQASTVAAARKEVTGLSEAHARLLGESVRCAAYALPGTKKLVKAAGAALDGERKAALLANHGAVCVGGTMEEAFRVAQALEGACESFIAEAFARRYGTRAHTMEEMHACYLKTLP
ncbi:class II aldolase/adducin family protein [Desulfoluna spongiiphila]|uniref:L-fuculose-phosphate aldolase n=1 Tax=Desulfoluna spongiiphila TaxID=419481 RepID=A0A1G5H2Y9_9BACT|nr:class II aldolase/adducin family protein [Desulfoluna spongiiphila]SCY58193.1 L-fuculose-phosphate aldolase [Desulfoluna spongiiphila]VVS94759.1 class ii aldolase/adducin n-terminal [Desulfoluna spongiiphila]